MMLLLGSVALAAPLTYGLPAEFDLLGRNIGVRPEVLVGLDDRDAHHLRVALGLLPGRQYLFVPLSAGWRWIGRPTRDWHPVTGFGAEAQSFWILDGAPVIRSAFYADLGAAYTLNPGLELSATASPELTVFGVPGVGLSLRAGVRWTPGQGSP